MDVNAVRDIIIEYQSETFQNVGISAVGRIWWLEPFRSRTTHAFYLSIYHARPEFCVFWERIMKLEANHGFRADISDVESKSEGTKTTHP